MESKGQLIVYKKFQQYSSWLILACILFFIRISEVSGDGIHLNITNKSYIPLTCTQMHGTFNTANPNNTPKETIARNHSFQAAAANEMATLQEKAQSYFFCQYPNGAGISLYMEDLQLHSPVIRAEVFPNTKNLGTLWGTKIQQDGNWSELIFDMKTTTPPLISVNKSGFGSFNGQDTVNINMMDPISFLTNLILTKFPNYGNALCQSLGLPFNPKLTDISQITTLNNLTKRGSWAKSCNASQASYDATNDTLTASCGTGNWVSTGFFHEKKQTTKTSSIGEVGGCIDIENNGGTLTCQETLGNYKFDQNTLSNDLKVGIYTPEGVRLTKLPGMDKAYDSCQYELQICFTGGDCKVNDFDENILWAVSSIIAQANITIDPKTMTVKGSNGKALSVGVDTSNSTLGTPMDTGKAGAIIANVLLIPLNLSTKSLGSILTGGQSLGIAAWLMVGITPLFEDEL